MWLDGRIPTNRYEKTFCTLSPRFYARLRPWTFVDLSYSGLISRSHSRYLSERESFWNHTHHIDLKLFPTGRIELAPSVDISSRELADGLHKTMSLLDCSVYYKLRKLRIGLSVNNILDQRHYSYQIFSGLDRFTYDYSLRGREFILSLRFTQ